MFENKWNENQPRITRITELIHDDRTSVVALLQWQNLYVFTIPERLVRDRHREIYFHFPGGKVEPNDKGDLLRALEREVGEEIGRDIAVESNKSETRYFNYEVEYPSFLFTDQLKPQIILSRPVRHESSEMVEDALGLINDPAGEPAGTNGQNVPWAIGYRARLHGQEPPQPRPPAAIAVLLLTADMLCRAFERRVTYRQIERFADGSRLVLPPSDSPRNIPFDRDALAVPTGLAAVFASTEFRHRLGQLT